MRLDSEFDACCALAMEPREHARLRTIAARFICDPPHCRSAPAALFMSDLFYILYDMDAEAHPNIQRSTRVPMRWLLVFWLFVLSTIAFLDRTNISIAGVGLAEEYGLTKVQLGGIFSAFLIGYAGFQIPGGWLAVRLGPRRVLTLGVMWWGAFTALTAVVSPTASHALLLLIMVRLGLGVGESVVYPAANQ